MCTPGKKNKAQDDHKIVDYDKDYIINMGLTQPGANVFLYTMQLFKQIIMEQKILAPFVQFYTS